MPGQYPGKYCIINLTSGEIETVIPDQALYRAYLGGYGLGAAVIMERQRPGVDALSPESYLGFCSGMLTGSKAFFSGRFMVVAKSPLTGGWGDANAGGYFSQELKRTGYDAVFFTGKAENPVWVSIIDGNIEIRDASGVWGDDAIETGEKIKRHLGDQRVQVASIGVSGEKISLISGIVTDDGRIAARSGLGSVMGSKKLKAVAVRGKQKVHVEHPDRIKEINRGFLKEFRKSTILDRITVRYINQIARIIAYTGISIPAKPPLLREIYKRYGTAGLTAYSALTGDMPIKNWGGVGYADFSFKSSKKISDENVLNYQKKRYACQNCPLGCGGIIHIRKGRYKGKEGYKPEYETLAAFGGLILQDDLDTIVEINEMCNRAGIDTISTGECVAFAIECFENGIIDEKMTGGLGLGWGKTEEVINLVDMIIQREGFGDLLADGVSRASQKIGMGSEKFALHVGGQELPMHDSRLDQGFAISYQCEPTPGRHTISANVYATLFAVDKTFPGAALMVRNVKGRQSKNVQRYIAGSFYMQLVNCSGLCLFGALTSSLPVVEYLNALTGWDLSNDEYLKIGERILNLRKAFNVREGVKIEQCKLPDRALGLPPLSKGPLKGITIDIDRLQKEFFETLGWSPLTGGPTKEKMDELGIKMSAAKCED